MPAFIADTPLAPCGLVVIIALSRIKRGTFCLQASSGRMGRSSFGAVGNPE